MMGEQAVYENMRKDEQNANVPIDGSINGSNGENQCDDKRRNE